jgi:hypothetical protein
MVLLMLKCTLSFEKFHPASIGVIHHDKRR